jgi:hypothetical protein
MPEQFHDPVEQPYHGKAEWTNETPKRLRIRTEQIEDNPENDTADSAEQRAQPEGEAWIWHVVVFEPGPESVKILV